ncbi:hypothetical protein [Acinetobacter sp. ANC 4635]|uniref:hypothetical protein n=1 Tax=Acinetobacter sp. ANC 4635 TaxID=2529846 RepID=UPI00103F9F6D|nr:hypothetical protein [Acinetobacter sp. ANC 4635]TCB32200.1 hypothetical protein E0H86_07225 [Acinetobacter sp. ANC 4635]
MKISQINVVISTKISGDASVEQKITDALGSLYRITYEELTDDVYQAIQLLKKAKEAQSK